MATTITFSDAQHQILYTAVQSRHMELKRRLATLDGDAKQDCAADLVKIGYVLSLLDDAR